MAAGVKPARLTYAIAVVTAVAFVAGLLLSSGEFTTEQMGFIALRFSADAEGFLIPAWLTSRSAA